MPQFAVSTPVYHAQAVVIDIAEDEEGQIPRLEPDARGGDVDIRITLDTTGGAGAWTVTAGIVYNDGSAAGRVMVAATLVNITMSCDHRAFDGADGVGEVGNPVCGDMMEMSIKVDDEVITDEAV